MVGILYGTFCKVAFPFNRTLSLNVRISIHTVNLCVIKYSLGWFQTDHFLPDQKNCNLKGGTHWWSRVNWRQWLHGQISRGVRWFIHVSPSTWCVKVGHQIFVEKMGKLKKKDKDWYYKTRDLLIQRSVTLWINWMSCGNMLIWISKIKYSKLS